MYSAVKQDQIDSYQSRRSHIDSQFPNMPAILDNNNKKNVTFNTKELAPIPPQLVRRDAMFFEPPPLKRQNATVVDNPYGTLESDGTPRSILKKVGKTWSEN